MPDRYDPQKHYRRSIRLKNYDYTQPGAYFVTICAYERECLFGEVIDGLMHMNGYGQIAQREWERLPARFKHIALGAFVVMPNHVHGIILITDDIHCRDTAGFSQNVDRQNVGARQDPSKMEAYKMPAVPLPGDPINNEQFGRPVPGSIPTIVRSYKSAVSLRIHHLRGTPAGTVWQRNYYERVVRNEEELRHLAEYILNNPLGWDTDDENPHS